MLNFDLNTDQGPDRTQLTMTAKYRPRGLLGLLYWYAVVPLHNIVFGGMLKGIRKAAEKSHLNKSKPITNTAMPPATKPGYGRARLWLGISSVGTMVTLSTLVLATGFRPGWIPSSDANFAAQVIGLLSFLAVYILVQLPFDVLGGFLLPKQFERSHPPLSTFLASLARGVLGHAALLLIAATLLTLAGMVGGRIGMIATGLFGCFLLLQFRPQIARIVGRLNWSETSKETSDAKVQANQQLNITEVQCDDEGFTGGIVGVFHPVSQLLPTRWKDVLGSEGFDLSLNRRLLAIKTGSWLRGRIVAVAFTLTGLIAAAMLVEGVQVGSAWGTIQFSLWFSLWSFLGLLTLPTLSRRGVIEIDEQAQMDGYPTTLMRSVTEKLDRLQDGEPVRSSLVETIFHPVPSVENRLDGPRSHQTKGYWDAARTTIYLSAAGVGLLGRAVHCNCGRPSLWVFLPTD